MIRQAVPACQGACQGAAQGCQQGLADAVSFKQAVTACRGSTGVVAGARNSCNIRCYILQHAKGAAEV
jgi:hypothetical protein